MIFFAAFLIFACVNLTGAALIPPGDWVAAPRLTLQQDLAASVTDEPVSTAEAYFVVSQYVDAACVDIFHSAGDLVSGCTVIEDQTGQYKSYSGSCPVQNSTCKTYIMSYFASTDCSGASLMSQCANVTFEGTTVSASQCYETNPAALYTLYSKGACITGSEPWNDGADGQVTL
jgi:hypothetical protein